MMSKNVKTRLNRESYSIYVRWFLWDFYLLWFWFLHSRKHILNILFKILIFLTFQCHSNVFFSQKNNKNLKIATISESRVIYQMIMQKMMDCNIIEEIKGKTKQIARCICYILSHGGEGNWYLEKTYKLKFKFNNAFSANRKISYTLFL